MGIAKKLLYGALVVVVWAVALRGWAGWSGGATNGLVVAVVSLIVLVPFFLFGRRIFRREGRRRADRVADAAAAATAASVARNARDASAEKDPSDREKDSKPD